MKIKQLIPVTPDYAVLATRKEHYSEPCYDRKLDDLTFFWALLDSGDECVDEVVLLEVSPDGYQEICERSLVVERKACPICGQKLHPRYNAKLTPESWQECAGCGHVLDTGYEANESNPGMTPVWKGGENDGE